MPPPDANPLRDAVAESADGAVATNVWGLLRRKGGQREEIKLIHRVQDNIRDAFFIGRSGSRCDVVVEDYSVSAVHCAIYCDYSEPKLRVFLEDNSTNGTFINGSLLRLQRGERMELRSGDEIFLINPRSATVSTAGADHSAANAAAMQSPVSHHRQQEENVAAGSFVFINLRDRLVARRDILNGVNMLPNDDLSTEETTASANNALPAVASIPSVPVAKDQRPHIEDKYIIGQEIGSGMSGKVYVCIDRATRQKYAVKVIDTRKFTMTPGISVSDLQQEAIMMKGLDHPNIIHVMDTYITDTSICIVMEYIRGGDLFERIVAKKTFSEENARKVMQQVLSAVQYLHERDIVHRDLKPENILLLSNESDTDIRVTDFGLAKKASQEGLKTFCGTPQYFAPEVLQRKGKNQKQGLKRENSTRYGTAVDMWSMGVILYILLSGTFPFDEEYLFDQIMRADYCLSGIEWNRISLGAKHLVRMLLTLRADQRITVSQALRHPWVQGVEYVPHIPKSMPLHNQDENLLRRTASLSRPLRKMSLKNMKGLGQLQLVSKPMSIVNSVVEITTSHQQIPTDPDSAIDSILATESSGSAMVLDSSMDNGNGNSQDHSMVLCSQQNDKNMYKKTSSGCETGVDSSSNVINDSQQMQNESCSMQCDGSTESSDCSEEAITFNRLQLASPSETDLNTTSVVIRSDHGKGYIEHYTVHKNNPCIAVGFAPQQSTRCNVLPAEIVANVNVNMDNQDIDTNSSLNNNQCSKQRSRSTSISNGFGVNWILQTTSMAANFKASNSIEPATLIPTPTGTIPVMVKRDSIIITSYGEALDTAANGTGSSPTGDAEDDIECYSSTDEKENRLNRKGDHDIIVVNGRKKVVRRKQHIDPFQDKPFSSSKRKADILPHDSIAAAGESSNAAKRLQCSLEQAWKIPSHSMQQSEKMKVTPTAMLFGAVASTTTSTRQHPQWPVAGVVRSHHASNVNTSASTAFSIGSANINSSTADAVKSRHRISNPSKKSTRNESPKKKLRVPRNSIGELFKVHES